MKCITLEDWARLTTEMARRDYPRWDAITPYHWRVSNLHRIQSDMVASHYLVLVIEEMKRNKPSAVVTISVSETHDCYDLHMSFNARTWTGRVIEYGSHFHDWLNDR